MYNRGRQSNVNSDAQIVLAMLIHGLCPVKHQLRTIPGREIKEYSTKRHFPV